MPSYCAILVLITHSLVAQYAHRVFVVEEDVQNYPSHRWVEVNVGHSHVFQLQFSAKSVLYEHRERGLLHCRLPLDDVHPTNFSRSVIDGATPRFADELNREIQEEKLHGTHMPFEATLNEGEKYEYELDFPIAFMQRKPTKVVLGRRKVGSMPEFHQFLHQWELVLPGGEWCWRSLDSEPVRHTTRVIFVCGNRQKKGSSHWAISKIRGECLYEVEVEASTICEWNELFTDAFTIPILCNELE